MRPRQLVAEALHYAHKRGLVHRDVKPGNVLLARGGRAVVTDLGLARSLDQALGNGDHVAGGTPAYMAPEQVLGRPVDARSDVYALGILLYELLTGAPPFDIGNSFPAVKRFHQQKDQAGETSPSLDFPPDLPPAGAVALAQNAPSAIWSGVP